MASYFLRAAVAAGLLFGAVGAAHAQAGASSTVEAVVFDSHSNWADQDIRMNLPTTTATASASALGSTVHASTSSEPGAEPTAGAHGVAAGGTTIFGDSQLQYEFQIVGPGGQQDPLQLSVNGFYSLATMASDDHGYGDGPQAGVEIDLCPTVCNSALNAITLFTANAGAGFATPGDSLLHAYSLSADITSNTIYQISLKSVVEIFNYQGTIDATADASIDPHLSFVVDGLGLDPSLYHLQLSEGIFAAPDGAGAAPEPQTWTLMILGFGALGAVLRSRRAALAA